MESATSPEFARYPQLTLSLQIGDVQLHVPDDAQLGRLADLASRPGGVLPREDEHFVGWLAGQEPAAVRGRLITMAQQHSWLARAAQRRGIGTRARCAVLDLAFGRLGVGAAFSWALPANTASTAISERLGYRVVHRAELRARDAETTYRLDVRGWQSHRPADLPQTRVTGADGLVDVLGS